MNRYAPSPETPSPTRIRPLWGEFADAKLEQAFRESRLAHVVAQQRISLLVWGVLLLAFAVPDYLSMGGIPLFWWLMAYRVVFVGFLAFTWLALRRTPRLALKGRHIMWLAFLFYPFFFLIDGLPLEMFMLNFGTLLITQLALFLFVPVRLAQVMPVALFGTIGATVMAWSIGMGAVATVSTLLLFCATTALGYVPALRMQKVARQEFLLRNQLQTANRELRAEMAQRVTLQNELEYLAGTDLLTGLANRRTFAAHFDRDVVRAQRSGEPLSLAMLDLDHFKQVNDCHGHAAGDAVLAHIGQLCAQSFRGVDLAARVGGEEFAVLLPGADAAQALTVLARYVHTLASTDIDIGGQTLRTTVTVGVAQHLPGESLDALMIRADAALYAGKQAGRNQVALASPPTSTAET